MKILGQHGQLDSGPRGYPPVPNVVRRHIEVEEGERLSVSIKDKATDEEEEIIGLFMPGVLKLEWEGFTKLERHD